MNDDGLWQLLEIILYNFTSLADSADSVNTYNIVSEAVSSKIGFSGVYYRCYLCFVLIIDGLLRVCWID